ncbi:hypothetical protein [Joostella sp. CR20]|uniref:hypothetical protein n=1 Tax=Joostella sp. CR20 TaxID=2804312 RepID=UPI00313E3E3A
MIATVFALYIALFVISLITKSIPAIKNMALKIIDYFYLILIPFPVVYLVLYSASLENGELSSEFFLDTQVAVTLKDLSIWFFTAGIFSATIKYLNTITYVKKKFKDIILSKEFDSVLSKKLEIMAYSKEYLKEHANIEDLWRKVTLLKYETEFPAIYSKLKDIVSNEFNEKNTSFYYKHFTMEFDLKLHSNNNDIEFEINTTFTIVRPNKEVFEWTFDHEVLTELLDTEKSNAIKVYNLDPGKEKEFEPFNKDVSPSRDGFSVVRLVYELKGKEEYHIKHKRIFTQDINKDRYYGFGSKRILDDLKVSIKHCDKLSVFFTNVNNVRFISEIKQGENTQTHTHNGLITPGENFKFFLIRK